MKLGYIEKSKYDSLIEQFKAIKETNPKARLKDFARENRVDYNNFRKAAQRKGLIINRCNSYTIMQISVGVELLDKLKKLAEYRQVSVPYVVRMELEKALNNAK